MGEAKRRAEAAQAEEDARAAKLVELIGFETRALREVVGFRVAGGAPRMAAVAALAAAFAGEWVEAQREQCNAVPGPSQVDEVMEMLREVVVETCLEAAVKRRAVKVELTPAERG